MKSVIRGNEKGVCYLCGRSGPTEEHHIFGGPNRKLSERYGLKVYLCIPCHRTGKQSVHSDRETMMHLKQAGQAAFEKMHTRQEFMELFGKNYLEDDGWEQDKRPITDGFVFLDAGKT